MNDRLDRKQSLNYMGKTELNTEEIRFRFNKNRKNPRNNESTSKVCE